jgi:putative transposase
VYPTVDSNALSERWVRTVRQECLDKILILNEGQLRQVLDNLLDYYNTRRPHQSLDQQSPVARPQSERTGLLQKREILGGIVNDYFWVPTQTSGQLA